MSSLSIKYTIVEQIFVNGLCWDQFKQGNFMSEGANGKVYEYMDNKNQKYAGKMIHLDDSEDNEEDIKKEIEILFKLNKIDYVSRYFPFLFGYAKLKINKKEFYVLFSELCQGSLKDLTMKRWKENGISGQPIFSLEENYIIFETVVKAVSILEENKILHRDIKPANILYNFEKGSLTVKLTDLGEGKFKRTSDETTIRGTKNFMSPECIFLIFTQQKAIYDAFISDIYSLGLTMLHINLGFIQSGTKKI